MSEDGVFDGHEDEADVFRVRGAGEVWIQRLVLIRVLFLVHFQDELLSCFGILPRSCDTCSLWFQRLFIQFVLITFPQNIETDQPVNSGK